jgi:hypothetical protein
MQKANTKIAPLFPYLHPGAIVPTGSLFIGGPGTNYGQFFHHNSVDEVIIAFVANGSTLQTGQAYNGGRVHGVNSFLKDQTKAGSFALFSVTQRQREAGAQPEAITINCSSCGKLVFKCEWDGASPPDATEMDHLFGGAAAPAQVRRFNEDPANRTCSECGHVNDLFPTDMWGWGHYSKTGAAMIEAKRVLLEAGGQAGKTS